jgi:cell pole-organizing protein PopZ
VTTKENEMSMEEILASIRKIIASDEDQDLPNTQKDKSQETPKLKAESSPKAPILTESFHQTIQTGVLDLTEEVQPDGSIVHRDPPVMPESQVLNKMIPPVEKRKASPFKQEMTHFSTSQNLETLRENNKMTTSGRSQEAAASKESLKEGTDTVLSTKAAIEAASSLSHLNKFLHTSKEESEKQTEGNLTLESLVLMAVKPYLKEWLDANLPQLVQKLVEAEIKKLIQKADIS